MSSMSSFESGVARGRGTIEPEQAAVREQREIHHRLARHPAARRERRLAAERVANRQLHGLKWRIGEAPGDGRDRLRGPGVEARGRVEHHQDHRRRGVRDPGRPGDDVDDVAAVDLVAAPRPHVLDVPGRAAALERGVELRAEGGRRDPLPPGGERVAEWEGAFGRCGGLRRVARRGRRGGRRRGRAGLRRDRRDRRRRRGPAGGLAARGEDHGGEEHRSPAPHASRIGMRMPRSRATSIARS